MLRDYTSGTESLQRALNIRQKPLGEDQEKTADSHHKLGITQFMLRDYTSAAESLKQALNLRQKVLGEDDERTADSYPELRITQIEFEDTHQPLSHLS